MAQLDAFVRNMLRAGAQGLAIASGAHAVLRLPSGDRLAAQNLVSHAALVAMTREVAPEAALAALQRGQAVEFAYPGGAATMRVRVSQQGRAWQVDITPGSSSPGEPATERTPSASPAPPPVPRAGAAAAAAPTASRSGVPEMVSVDSRSGKRHSTLSLAVPPSSPGLAPAAGGSEDTRGMERLLRRMLEAGASDLHLTTGARPSVRVDGHIAILESEPVLSAEALAALVQAVAPPKNRAEFATRNDTDFAWEVPGLARFRFNLFLDRRGPGAVVRAVPFELRNPTELGLPPDVLELCKLHKGLVLVTGATGSGKSTTLASLINHINETRNDHIITIEDPIEFVHESKRCLVHQREVGRHTQTFRDALRAALREDPDVVLVGELRDLETMAMAVETAETGHLVFGTLHTSTAPSTVDRVIDQFPADRQNQIRQMLSESLRAVITQSLCRRIGVGRVAAFEILFNSSAVANLIRERKTFQIPSVMQTGRGAGMVTMNDSLLDLARRKVIDANEAVSLAHNKVELRTALQRDGFRVEAVA